MSYLGAPFAVGEPQAFAWVAAIEQITQDGLPCVLDANGKVVAVVVGRYEDGGAIAQRIAAALNGEPS